MAFLFTGRGGSVDVRGLVIFFFKATLLNDGVLRGEGIRQIFLIKECSLSEEVFGFELKLVFEQVVRLHFWHWRLVIGRIMFWHFGFSIQFI